MSVLFLVSLSAILFGLLVGSISLPGLMLSVDRQDRSWTALQAAWANHWAIIEAIRLPRVLTAFAVGGLLGLSGNLMQLLLRNPLADPYVLGLSAWASLGAMAGMLWSGLTFGLPLGALMGAALAGGVMMRLVHHDAEPSPDNSRLILSGVALGAIATAGLTLVLYLAPDERLRGMVFWLMGDLARADWPKFAWLLLAISLGIMWRRAAQLNIWLLGESLAATYGVPMRATRYWLLCVACITAAAAVSLSGPIGFVGLIVPHGVRLILGHDQRIALPAVVAIGGSFLVLADALARSLFAPIQLPVGLVMVGIGVPIFLGLLWRRPS